MGEARENGDDEEVMKPWGRRSCRCASCSVEGWANVHVWAHRSTEVHKSTQVHERWSYSLCHRMKQEGWANGDDEKKRKASGCQCAS